MDIAGSARSTRARRRRGQAFVETALFLAFMPLLVLGVFRTADFLRTYRTILDGTRFAARYMADVGYTTGGVTTGTYSVGNAPHAGDRLQETVRQIFINTYKLQVDATHPLTVTVSNPTAQDGVGNKGDVKLIVRYTYPALGWTAFGWGNVAISDEVYFPDMS